jgi:lincosamide nucleotidyltransferase A/C/D/E
MSRNHTDMPAEKVIEIIQLFNSHRIEAIIDGGWAVDALLGEQTRPHLDLDLAVFHKDVPLIRSLLEERGYQEVPQDDSWECNFVYGNDRGYLIDIHSCTFDEEKKKIFGVEYHWDSLQGEGVILGHRVRCIPPDWLVDFHSGYDLDHNDYHDVRLLCEKFDLPLPDEFSSFLEK